MHQESEEERERREEAAASDGDASGIAKAPADVDDEPRLSETLAFARDAQKGDDQAWDRLYVRCHRRIMAWLRHERLPLGFEREDVFQAVMQNVVRSIPRFRIDPYARFWGWLRTIFDNTLTDLWRSAGAAKRGKGREMVMRDCFGSSHGADPAVAGRELRQSVVARFREIEASWNQALSELPPKYRDVVVLRDQHALEYDEIAKRLGYNSGDTVRLVCHRGRQKLRVLLQRFDDGSHA
jgi:RNA polymerase sigma factor (sigma-70 family)